MTNKPAKFNPADLDYVSALSIKQKSGTITLASATATTFTGTISGLATGEVIDVEDEYLYVSNHSTPTVERAFGHRCRCPLFKTGSTYVGMTKPPRRCSIGATTPRNA